jgi:hypothetical protein
MHSTHDLHNLRPNARVIPTVPKDRLDPEKKPRQASSCTTYRICLHRPRMPPMNWERRALVGLNLPRASLSSNGTVYCGDDSIGPDY